MPGDLQYQHLRMVADWAVEKERREEESRVVC